MCLCVRACIFSVCACVSFVLCMFVCLGVPLSISALYFYVRICECGSCAGKEKRCAWAPDTVYMRATGEMWGVVGKV